MERSVYQSFAEGGGGLLRDPPIMRQVVPVRLACRVAS